MSPSPLGIFALGVAVFLAILGPVSLWLARRTPSSAGARYRHLQLPCLLFFDMVALFMALLAASLLDRDPALRPLFATMINIAFVLFVLAFLFLLFRIRTTQGIPAAHMHDQTNT